MESIVMDSPNVTVDTVPVQEVSTGLDSIAAKMAAMRNQVAATIPTETGAKTAAAVRAPVAPDTAGDSDTDLIEPEIADSETEYTESNEEDSAPEEVSESDSSDAELIDFLEFTNENPNAKFKFMRNGKEVVIDAKKAASILGQGAAISEDARQLKVEKAEFDEYLQTKRSETEGLLLAMEFTVRPQLQKAYDEILKTQGYQTTFHQQLAATQDPSAIARIQAAMAQNERYIQQQSATIGQLKPNVDQFYQIRSQQVREVLENNRKNFQDKELRNSYVYNEVREKVAKDWAGAKSQLVPGIENIDLISSDEHLLGLLRDGLKFRDRPRAKQSGNSIAALTSKRAGTQIAQVKDQLTSLQEKAKGGDRNAQDNLLVAKMNAMRQKRQ